MLISFYFVVFVKCQGQNFKKHEFYLPFNSFKDRENKFAFTPQPTYNSEHLFPFPAFFNYYYFFKTNLSLSCGVEVYTKPYYLNNKIVSYTFQPFDEFFTIQFISFQFHYLPKLFDLRFSGQFGFSRRRGFYVYSFNYYGNDWHTDNIEFNDYGLRTKISIDKIINNRFIFSLGTSYNYFSKISWTESTIYNTNQERKLREVITYNLGIGYKFNISKKKNSLDDVDKSN